MKTLTIILILCIHLITTKSGQENFILSSANTEGNALSDIGNTKADSNSDAAVSLVKDSSLSMGRNKAGDQIIALSGSKSNAFSLTGNAQAGALSTAESEKKEITNNITEFQPNLNNLVLAIADSQANAATLSGNAQSLAVTITQSNDSAINNSDNSNLSNVGSNIESNLITNCYETEWDDLGIRAKAISVNHKGQFFYVSEDGYLNRFELVGKRSKQVKGEIHIGKLVKVTTGSDNSLFAINKYGDAFYLPHGDAYNNKWMKLDGCFRDIAVSRTGSIYKLGCDNDVNSGFIIYRLICNNNTFITDKYGLTNEDDCFWFRLDQKAIRIAISPKGTLYLIDISNDVYSFDGLETRKFSDIKARDISVSNDGIIFLTGIPDNYLYKIIDDKYPVEYECFNTNAIAVQAGPLNLPFIITDNGFVHFTSKYSFN
jgi:hypothetical protein